MDIRFEKFATDESILAKVIYGKEPHMTTNLGIVLSSKVREELRTFLDGYNKWVGVTDTPYYRIDAYFNQESLSILEINAWFVDGWGTALNLARASNIRIDPQMLTFPSRFASEAAVYLPELKLFLSELKVRDYSNNEILDHIDDSVETYVYGRVNSDNPMIVPKDGPRLDNKMNLAEYSVLWDGHLVKVPMHYTCENARWDNIPDDAVLKFCDKSSEQCERTGHSVLMGKPSGKAPFLRSCYEAKQLIAQERIKPRKHEETNCQLVILAIGDLPITGYVQYSPRSIINDSSTHGPLLIE